jgi:hypothetical protein
VEFDFGNTTAKAFFERHPNFYDSFECIMATANKVFGREMTPNNRLEDVCFGLGHTCREDFLQITLLACHGFGTGASQLFRSLYERAVVLTYLLKYPDKLERFINYAAIQEHRMLDGALRSGITEDQFDGAMTTSGNSVAEIRKRYNDHKPTFQTIVCAEHQITRTAASWDLDVPAMVHKVGSPYTNIFLMGYAIPNLHIHATLSVAMADFGEARKLDLSARAQRKEHDGDFVLSLASGVLVDVLKRQNELFKLGLEKELEVCDQVIMDVWEPYLEAKNTP